jgi:hypothetical protein
MLLVDGPAVLTPSGIAKSHAAHADAGYIQFRVAEFCIFHEMNVSLPVILFFIAQYP